MKQLGIILIAIMIAGAAFANGEAEHPKQIHWSFDGVTGKVDKQSAQRGLQVYKEVCSACHGLSQVPFRALADIGFSEAEIKALAATYSYTEIGDDGEPKDRAGRPSDRFKPPFPNEKASRAANGGAYPPDLSLMVKARHDGANYIYSLLTGYHEPAKKLCTGFDAKGACTAYRPATEADAAVAKTEQEALVAQEVSLKTAGKEVPARTDQSLPNQIYSCLPHGKAEECVRIGSSLHYNPYFPGHQIAMPAPLSEGQVSYQDGTVASLDQEAKDIVNFLQWAAEPEMEQRKLMGIRTIAFLFVMTVFLFLAYKRVWRNIH